MSSRGQSTRPTFHRDALPIAIYVLAGHGRVLEGEPYVVGNEQVEMAIPVVVEETASRSPAWLIVAGLTIPGLTIPKAGGLGYVSKRSITVVTIKAVLPKIGTEDVLESIVVVVADADARGPSHGLQSCLLRNVGEGAVAIVLVEAVGRARRISG